MVKEQPTTTTTAAKVTGRGVVVLDCIGYCLVQIFSCLVRIYYDHPLSKKTSNDKKNKSNHMTQPQKAMEDQHVISNDKNDDDDNVVQVYILLGQSNMLGMGQVGSSQDDITKDGTLQCAVHQKGLYPYLLTDQKEWSVSQNVRNVRVMENKQGKMGVYKNEFMTIHDKDLIGPEVGIGHFIENTQAEEDTNNQGNKKIMLLKSCIGNRSLGWDLLPPGSQRYNYKGQTYAGYKDSPDKWDQDKPKPPPINWYAGKQYDTDIANAKAVLKDIGTYYPGATQYKVVGFFWWQGDKDRYVEAHSVNYESNLVRLIQQLRADFDAPQAKFVLATLGQTAMKDDKTPPNDQAIFDAMLAVDGNAGKYPAFVGNVATVYSHPLSKGGASNGHYNGNAETYMNVGEAMGKAMAELVPSNRHNQSRSSRQDGHTSP